MESDPSQPHETSKEIQEETLKNNLSTEFVHNNNIFNTKAENFGNRPNESWYKVSVNIEGLRPRFMRKPEKTETQVADITLKLKDQNQPHGKTFHIMGNYNLTFGQTENPARGVVGVAIQDIVEKSGYTLEVDGLTDQGVKLYERLLANHRDTVNVEKTGVAEYKIYRKESTKVE